MQICPVATLLLLGFSRRDVGLDIGSQSCSLIAVLWVVGESFVVCQCCCVQYTASLLGLTTWGQWVVELLLYIATLPGGSGYWNSCNTLPHYLRAVGSGTPVVHCHTAWGQWAVEPVQHTATLPRGSGQWNSCTTPPHCPGLVGSGTRAFHRRMPWGSGQGNSCITLPHRMGAVGSGTPATHCHTAWGHWVVALSQNTATLLGGIGLWNSCGTLPQCLGAVGSGSRVVRCHIAWGRCTAWAQWAELLHCTTALPGGSGRWNFCCTLPHHMEQWVVDLYNTPLHG